ncbi:MAG: hypothetical protein ABDH49_02610 [Candidatus Hydrothermales bacterium]
MESVVYKVLKDFKSGSEELLLTFLKGVLTSRKKIEKDEFLKAISKIIEVHPSMAVFYKLLEETVKVNEENLKDFLIDLTRRVEETPRKIAEKVYGLLKDTKGILLHSRSSTTIKVLRELKKIDSSFNPYIYCTESRPGEEGKVTEKELKKIGFETKLIPDFYVTKIVDHLDAIIFGADAVYEDKIINKVGTFSLVLIGNFFKIPTFCLTSRMKISNNFKSLKRVSDLFEEVPKKLIDHFVTDE